MQAPGDEPRQEIIIVRRGGHDDDHGHHGGVWKIAFADFMTAMMCFFLVMWLINASNEETKAAVASYFNPVKLTDRAPTQKGIDTGTGTPTEIKGKAPDTQTERDKAQTGPAENKDASTMTEVSDHTEKNLFLDPYAVLAEIAEGTGTMQNVSSKGEGGAQDSGPSTGASGGESYRDPFAPDFWSSQVEQPRNLGDTAEETFDEGLVVASGDPARKGAPPAPAAIDDSTDIPENPFAVSAPAPTKPEALAAAAQAPAEPKSIPKNAEELAEKVRRELAATLSDPELIAGITVVPTEAGISISVADDIADGMFEIGSAVPRRDLVRAMEKIGRMLAALNGQVTINGHTDARPFATAGNDNWRLSTARAHATYYMLVRGGLDERRVSSVAGFADRRLKVPSNPLASANRRIEILVETAG